MSESDENIDKKYRSVVLQVVLEWPCKLVSAVFDSHKVDRPFLWVAFSVPRGVT